MAHSLERDPAGLYCICVFNAESSSDEEIVELFKQFGPIVNINRSKNLVFVRYEKYEEALKCLEVMKFHSRFKVNPGKRKSSDKSDSQRNRDRSTDHHRGAEMGNSKNASNNSSLNSEAKPITTMPDLKYCQPEPEDDAVPIANEPCYLVTMAHLPPDMLQCDIYFLCTKARAPPVHVEMKSFTCEPYSPVYYAIVYVKSTSEVDIIVRSFNNLKVNGYQMVVAPYESLVAKGRHLNGVTT